MHPRCRVRLSTSSVKNLTSKAVSLAHLISAIMVYMSLFPKNIVSEISTVRDGNMSFKAGAKQDVITHRIDFLGKFNIAPHEYIAMRCDHGDRITLVDHNDKDAEVLTPEEQIQSEVLVTQKKHLALFLLTADCLPVSFYDKTTHTIALAHISRRTLVAGLVQKTIGFLNKQLGVLPQNLLIYIGPHIKKESYVFSLPLQENSKELEDYVEINNGQAHIDLTSACTAELKKHGVLKKNIAISEIDTGVSDQHYSYFKMKKNNEIDTPRMATILMMR